MEHASERRDQTAAHVTDGKLRMPVWMLAVLLAVATLRRITPQLVTVSLILTTHYMSNTEPTCAGGTELAKCAGRFEALMHSELATTDVDFTHGGLPVFWIEPNWHTREPCCYMQSMRCCYFCCSIKRLVFGGEFMRGWSVCATSLECGNGCVDL